MRGLIDKYILEHNSSKEKSLTLILALESWQSKRAKIDMICDKSRFSNSIFLQVFGSTFFMEVQKESNGKLYTFGGLTL